MAFDIAFSNDEWKEIEPLVKRFSSQNKLSRQATFAKLVIRAVKEKAANDEMKEAPTPKSNPLKILSQARRKTDLEVICEKLDQIDEALGSRIQILSKIVLEATKK